MKLLLYSLLLNLLSLSAPTILTSTLKDFIHDAVDKKLTNIEIGDKYFCTAVLHRTDHYGEKARGYLEYALSQQRNDLRTQQINPDDVVFTPFNELSPAELPPKPFHMLSETAHVYAARYHGKILFYLLMQENKIASTLLIGQGDEHYFINLCH